MSLQELLVFLGRERPLPPHPALPDFRASAVAKLTSCPWLAKRETCFQYYRDAGPLSQMLTFLGADNCKWRGWGMLLPNTPWCVNKDGQKWDDADLKSRHGSHYRVVGIR